MEGYKKEKTIRLLLAVALFAAAGMLSIDRAAAQEKITYPWCSVTPGFGTQCTHPSFGECMFDVQGIRCV